MIPRYTREAMAAIWSPEAKFRIWLEIEAYACEAQEILGVIPKGTAKIVWEKGKFNVKRIDEIEAEVKHDVIAFLTSLAESIGEPSRFVHQGMTSSDVVDTCYAIQLKKSADLLLEDLSGLLDVLKTRSLEHQNTICIGRSHGIHAEPTTFGLKLLGFYAEFSRHFDRLQRAREQIAIGVVSGAVGTYSTIDPFVEQYICEKMGLVPETISTQVIPRDRHAELFSVFGLIASSIERIATEIRHLQRTEVREAEEFFSAGQKGSSAMPHKRNPISSENLTGLARYVRSGVIPAMENVALWHERDISHSSVERFIGPDITVALDFALGRLTGVMKNLLVYPDQMRRNLDMMGGLVFSQRVLLALTQKGIAREDAYRLVQRNAMKVWEREPHQRAGAFMEFLKSDKDVTLSAAELTEIFNEDYYTKHVPMIFERVLGSNRHE